MTSTAKFSPELTALAQYMAGEFDNKEQAIGNPAWYVHLKLWQRPLPQEIFPNSITLFAEQANVLTLDQSYRPRIVQLFQTSEIPNTIQAQYYMAKDLKAVQGAARELDKLQRITPDSLELLPSCKLTVTWQSIAANEYRFKAVLPKNTLCNFTYQGQTFQVDLGFEASPNQLLTFDRGINPQTGKAIWGALLGPYEFTKRQDYNLQIVN
ncbi:MAG: chromophore lyase CpcT/CpeT [Microcoleaceae cyanobacterium]